MKWAMDERNIPEWLGHLEQFEMSLIDLMEMNHYEPVSENIWIENENDARFAVGTRIGISLCSIYHEAIRENFSALIRLLKPEAMPIAAFVCLRSIIESCANILFIYDESIELKERYQRSCALQIKNLRERKSFYKSILEQREVDRPAHEAEINRCEKYEKMLLQHASGIGVDIPNEMICINYTKLVDQVLGKKAEYKIFSGVSHSYSWSTQVLFFEPIPEMANAEGFVPVEKKLKPEFIYWGCHLALVCVCHAEWAIWRAHKWDLESLASLITKAYNNLHLPQIELPWI